MFIFCSIYTKRIFPLADRDIGKCLIPLADNINKMEQGGPRGKRLHPLPFALC